MSEEKKEITVDTSSSGSSSSSSSSSTGDSSSSSSSSSTDSVSRTPLKISKSLQPVKEPQPERGEMEEMEEMEDVENVNESQEPIKLTEREGDAEVEALFDDDDDNDDEDNTTEEKEPEKEKEEKEETESVDETKDEEGEEESIRVSSSSEESGSSSSSSGSDSSSSSSSSSKESSDSPEATGEAEAGEAPIDQPESLRQLSKTPVEPEEDRFEKVLTMYYKLKNTYEAKKRKIQNSKDLSTEVKKDQIKKIKCIYCARAVGTTFGRQGQIIFARCGDRRQPCPLDIRINRGNFVQIEPVKQDLEDEVHDIERQMSILKMKVLYGQLTETQASSIFSDIEETYNQYTNYLNQLRQEYDQIRFDYREENGNERMEQLRNDLYVHIKEFQELLRLYKQNERTEQTEQSLLRDAIKKYVDDIYPIQREIRNLRYAVYEVSKLPYDPLSVSKDPKQSKLVPTKLYGFSYTLDDTEMVSEEPRILAFMTKRYKIKPDELDEEEKESMEQEEIDERAE